MTQQTASAAINISASHSSALQRFVWNFTDTFVVMRRNLYAYQRQPELVIFATFQPVMFLLLFTYVFGGAISFSTGGDYINFLLPGIIIQTILFASANTTVGLSVDLSRGIIDRFRSLPMSRAAVLAGRTSADTLRGLVTVTIMIVVGYIIGFRFEDWGSGLLGLALAVAFGYSVTWIAATIGLFVKDPETAQVAGFIWLFPMTFASSIFVPTRTMTAEWLRAFAENQPVSVVANTVRDLMTGTVNPDEIAISLLWIAGIVAVFLPMAVWRYARVASR
ncbi:MAG: ABC transporter permease [Chloroflexi bacterium]|nr:ABC transporter permease [Chloroflexota bacterium]MCY3582460.1 ABC transporter permease [Chloroflexota bacterium]MCY3717385.1 ABC transporter permease [Chloroflexota bacterium]MDE2651125.1 ABC transporter permease [Chloroflexota bacterium]MXV93108.1 ABC transporter permease [Chloroflexota bacterium]